MIKAGPLEEQPVSTMSSQTRERPLYTRSEPKVLVTGHKRVKRAEPAKNTWQMEGLSLPQFTRRDLDLRFPSLQTVGSKQAHEPAPVASCQGSREGGHQDGRGSGLSEVTKLGHSQPSCAHAWTVLCRERDTGRGSVCGRSGKRFTQAG